MKYNGSSINDDDLMMLDEVSSMISAGVEIIKQSLSVSSLISIFGLRSVQKIVLNQYKLSILALFTFKFPKFQRVYSTELKIKSASKLRKGK